MEFWITFWTVLFFFCIAIFAGVAVIVAVGGVADIRALFAGIDEKHREENSGE